MRITTFRGGCYKRVENWVVLLGSRICNPQSLLTQSTTNTMITFVKKKCTHVLPKPLPIYVKVLMSVKVKPDSMKT